MFLQSHTRKQNLRNETMRDKFTINSLHKVAFLLGIVLAAAGLFPSCDMMDGIYDETLTSSSDGTSGSSESSTQKGDSVVATDSAGNEIIVNVKSGQYYINATSYTQWVYINLHGDSLVITTSDICIDELDGQTNMYPETGAPGEWDYAHHRYDVKTNGAKVMMTDFHDIADLEQYGAPPSGTWVEDVYDDNSVTVDMSHMLEGYLTYAPGYKNTEAGKWLNVDTSNMPPEYTMYDNVMLYHLADGTYAAFQLVDFMSDDRYQTKGWMTVNYKYPVFVNQK